jgi:hypothetical protein
MGWIERWRERQRALGSAPLCQIPGFLEPCMVSWEFFFFSFFETGSHSIGQVGLELSILQLKPPECWDYRCAPLYPAAGGIYNGGSPDVPRSRVVRISRAMWFSQGPRTDSQAHSLDTRPVKLGMPPQPPPQSVMCLVNYKDKTFTAENWKDANSYTKVSLVVNIGFSSWGLQGIY